MYGFVLTRDGTFGIGDENKKITRITIDLDKEGDNNKEN